jgi:hypothetical protein
MQCAQMPLLWMSIRDVSRITSGALHLDFNPIGSGQLEVPLDNWPGKVVHFFEHVSFAIVKVSLPMPRRVSTGACSAKHEELRIGRPLPFLNVAAMLTVRRFKVLGCQGAAFDVANLDSRFIDDRALILGLAKKKAMAQ